MGNTPYHGESSHSDYYWESSIVDGAQCIADFDFTFAYSGETGDYTSPISSCPTPGFEDRDDFSIDRVNTMSIYWTDDRGEHELELSADNMEQDDMASLLIQWGAESVVDEIEVDPWDYDDEYYPDELTEWHDYDPDC